MDKGSAGARGEGSRPAGLTGKGEQLALDGTLPLVDEPISANTPEKKEPHESTSFSGKNVVQDRSLFAPPRVLSIFVPVFS